MQLCMANRMLPGSQYGRGCKSTQLASKHLTYLLLVCFAMCLCACAGVGSHYSEQNQAEFKPKLATPAVNDARISQPPYLLLHNKFRQWLVKEAFAPNRIELLLTNASPSIIHIVDLQNGDLPEMQFPSWFVAGGRVPTSVRSDLEQSPTQTSHTTLPMDFKRPTILSALYIGHFFQQFNCQATNKKSADDPITLDEYRHLHQFLVHEAIWTPHDYEIAESALVQITANNNTTNSSQC